MTTPKPRTPVAEIRKRFRANGIRRVPREPRNTKTRSVQVHTTFAQYGSRFTIYDNNTYWEEVLYEQQQDTGSSGSAIGSSVGTAPREDLGNG